MAKMISHMICWMTWNDLICYLVWYDVTCFNLSWYEKTVYDKIHDMMWSHSICCMIWNMTWHGGKWNEMK
jgi:hypothetical protein